MNAIKNIIQKELTRVFTDKKLIVSLFIMPGLLILVMYSLMGKLASNFMEDIEKNIPTIYIQNAPDNLNEVISAVGFEAELYYLETSENLDSYKNEILQGNLELLVVFEEGFSNKIKAYSVVGDPIPEVKTYFNSSEDYSGMARNNFVNRVLGTYQQGLLAERLGNIEQLQVFYIDNDPATSDIVDPKKADGKAMSMLLPLLINIMLFSGAMGLGVDAITGEKERGTLSSMLLSPIKRSEIVFGKLVSLAILSTISAIIYAFCVTVGIQRLTGGEMEGFGNISFSPVEMLQLLAILVVIVYMYVAFVALVAVYARTAKEANTYVMPLMIVVMLGSVMTMFSGASEKGLELFMIPVYNTAISIQNLLIGELTMVQFGLTLGSTALMAVFVTALITKAFNSEKIMFNA